MSELGAGGRCLASALGCTLSTQGPPSSEISLHTPCPSPGRSLPSLAAPCGPCPQLVGMRYLHEVLRPVISRVFEEKKYMELDPCKMDLNRSR